jgi:hypothetical protein
MADAIKDRASVLGSFPLQVRGKSVLARFLSEGRRTLG